MRNLCSQLQWLTLLCLVTALLTQPAGAYSVLSHEEVVDMAWLPHIVPLLHARFPNLSDADLREAHAYAYGGSVIQDIGYYPFGDHEFSDLLHYVRTGDFVSALLRESSTPDEYAFALGALAHYCGDIVGHPAINAATSQEYPRLRRRFGPVVTYDNNKTAHVRTEFGFDVAEVAHGRYSQQNYRDFIGFLVAKPQLERAFAETYGFPLASLMKHEDLAIGTYRRAVSRLIPEMTNVALLECKGTIQKEDPGFDRNRFVYRLKRTEYDRNYGTQYAHTGFGSRLLAVTFSAVPRVGPFKVFAFRVPNAQEQDIYIRSINGTVDKLNRHLANLQARHISGTLTAARPQPGLDLPEVDLDTGKPSELGEYRLADETYARLLHRLVADPAIPILPDVRNSLADFYAKPIQPTWYAHAPKAWQTLQADLSTFRQRTSPAIVTSTPPRS